MNLAILRQALTELKQERAQITSKYDSTIEGLEFIIKQSSTKSGLTDGQFLSDLPMFKKGPDRSSYIDLAVEAITEAGTDLRVNDIHAYILQRRPGLKRNALWSNLLSHVRKTGANSRLIKSGKGTFGIRRAA